MAAVIVYAEMKVAYLLFFIVFFSVRGFGMLENGFKKWLRWVKKMLRRVKKKWPEMD